MTFSPRCCWRATAPVLIAPAMNDEMFADPQTQDNLERLRRRGVAIVGPEIGALAEGPSERPGRMSEPETILAHAARLVRGMDVWPGAGSWSPPVRPASPSTRSGW